MENFFLTGDGKALARQGQYMPEELIEYIIDGIWWKMLSVMLAYEIGRYRDHMPSVRKHDCYACLHFSLLEAFEEAFKSFFDLEWKSRRHIFINNIFDYWLEIYKETDEEYSKRCDSSWLENVRRASNEQHSDKIGF